MDDALQTPEQLIRANGATIHHYALKPRQHGRLKVLSTEEVMNAPPRTYLLDGLMAPGECSVWWGGPKSGKTFLLLRLTYGMSQGRGMWGREASKVAVCYVAAEGASGLKGRIHALHNAMGSAPDFHLIAQMVDLFDPEADLSDLITVLNDRKCGLVVLDTLARVMGKGDENYTRDMNTFVQNCDRIREETTANTHVAIVHHGGWDSSHARGSIALIGAADLVIKISGENGGSKTALVEHAKDDEAGYGLGFELQVVGLADAPRGRSRSTCLAVDTELITSEKFKPKKKLADDAESLLRHMRDEIAAGHGVNARPIAEMPLVPTLSRSVLHQALIKRDWLQTPQELPTKEGAGGRVPDAEWKRLNKRLTLLQNHGLIGFDREWVWLAKPAAVP